MKIILRAQRWRLLPGLATIHDLESARQAGRRAAEVAYVCAIVLVLQTHLPPTSSDIRVYADAALFAGLGFGINKVSRSCAVSALLLYVANVAFNSRGSLGKDLIGSPVGHLAMWVEEGFRRQTLTDGDILALILEGVLFAWLTTSFAEGIRGTFAFHRYKNEQAAVALISS